MVFAVSDLNGNILGLYRMPDATYFSIARGGRQGPKRRVLRQPRAASADRPDQGCRTPARHSRPERSDIVSLPFFPEGIDINPPGPGSILTDGGVTKFGTNKGAPLPASAFQSIQGFNDFNPNTNFHQVITP